MYDAAEKYQEAGFPLLVLAGKEYGSGSSRDWAAKGPFLLVSIMYIYLTNLNDYEVILLFSMFSNNNKTMIRRGTIYESCLHVFCELKKIVFWYPQGIKAVLAESYERIHRSNLVGMGIIPLEYLPGQTADSLGLTGRERYTVVIPEQLTPRIIVDIKVHLIFAIPPYLNFVVVLHSCCSVCYIVTWTQ